MNNWLDYFEKRLQEFFEHKLQNLGRKDLYFEITQSVLNILQLKVEGTGEKRFAPNIFRISLKETTALDPGDINAYSETLKDIIKEACQAQGLILRGPIHIQFFTNRKQKSGIDIESSFSSPLIHETTKINRTENPAQEESEILPGFLISSSDEIYEIHTSTVNIGRRNDNDLIIDNLLVSRLHAQIRTIHGEHVLFDIDSTAGTRVNGQRVQQHHLRPGDIIEIADSTLIYYRDLDDQYSKSLTGFTKKIS